MGYIPSTVPGEGFYTPQSGIDYSSVPIPQQGSTIRDISALQPIRERATSHKQKEQAKKQADAQIRSLFYNDSQFSIKPQYDADGNLTEYYITYTGADGQILPGTIPLPHEGTRYTQAELNALKAQFPSATSSSGSSSGSGSYGSSRGYSGPDKATASRTKAQLEKLAGIAKQTAQTNVDYSNGKLNVITPQALIKDDTILNAVENSNAKSFFKSLQQESKDEIDTAALEELMSAAGIIAENVEDATDLQTKKSTKALLKQIKQDPTLYNAIVSQLRGDAAAGVTAGDSVANILNTAAEANASYKAAADKINEQFGGAGQDSIAAQTRNTVAGALASGYNTYTEQQIAALGRMIGLKEADLANFITAVESAQAGMGYEVAADERASNKALTDAEIKAALQGAKSDAAANAIINAISTTSGVVGSTTPVSNVTGGEAALNYKVPDYIAQTISNLDSKTYQDLVDSGLIDWILNKGYKRFANNETESKLAKQFGLSDLVTDGAVEKKYAEFQTQANRASDRTLTNAQKAYLTAIAAGDTKTADQLTRLAETASTSKANMYNAGAVANQYKQQVNNANVSNDLMYDRQIQALANSSALAQSKINAAAQRKAWGGNGNDVSGTTTLGGAFNRYKTDGATANAAIGDLYNSAIGGVSSINDVSQSNVNSANKAKADLRNKILNNNAAAAGAVGSAKQNIGVLNGIIKR